MKAILAIVTGLSILSASPAHADWFLSSETKSLIVKAEAGDVDAQFRVGNAYDVGKGAPRNVDESIRWYRVAADAGNAEAQNSLGSVLQANKKYTEALVWYEKASAQGHSLASNNLAYLYDLGLGVPQDRQKGFELYSKAANLGWAEAMWNIANMYGAGQFGAPDLLLACVWTGRAKRYAGPSEKQLQTHLARAAPQLERMLSTEQLSSCKEQVESWSPAQRESRQ